jgi:hypothetical protein
MVDGRAPTGRFTMREGRIRIIGAGRWRKGDRRMTSRPADYADDRGEIVGTPTRVPNTLPSPEELVLRDDTIKVTLALGHRPVEFFKHEATKRKIP